MSQLQIKRKTLLTNYVTTIYANLWNKLILEYLNLTKKIFVYVRLEWWYRTQAHWPYVLCLGDILWKPGECLGATFAFVDGKVSFNNIP